MTIQASKLTIQRWGSSLAVRIPTAVAKRLHFEIGTSIELIIQKDEVTIRRVENKAMTLDERLACFDSKQHGGEIIPSEPIEQNGAETF